MKKNTTLKKATLGLVAAMLIAVAFVGAVKLSAQNREVVRESVCTDHDDCILIRHFDSESNALLNVEHKKGDFTSEQEHMLYVKERDELAAHVTDLATDAIEYELSAAAEEL